MASERPGLEALLLAQIDREGPMSLADYMALCLHHPAHGYYATRDPFGQDGDFVTAPEISQMFGEIMGLALAQAWLDQGAPAPFVLCELGPGRGTLMADILRATARVPGFQAAMRLCLVEASPTLRDIQTRTLAPQTPLFLDTIGDLPDLPLFLIANEFFDALPIRAYQRTAEGWAEWRVGAADGALSLGLAPGIAAGAFGPRAEAFAPGQILETCAAGEAIATEIGRRIATRGGAAYLIDYGDTESIGDTLQAVSGHRYAGILERPGQVDLSAHVAFGPLIRAAHPARGHGPVAQGAVLARLGLHHRAEQLAGKLTGPALQQHRAAEKRLTDGAEMGTLFKIVGIAPDGAPPPPGLEPDPQ